MKENHYIRHDQARKIFKAFDYAKDCGTSLNIFAVIYLDNIPSQSSLTAYRKLCFKYRTWLKYKEKSLNKFLEPTYVFTMENPNNNTHVNWVLYVPNELKNEFMKKLPIWLKKVQGEIGHGKLWSDTIEMNGYKSTANYILKGIDPDYIDTFFLRALHDKKGPQGLIHGQRAGVSRSLGPKRIKHVMNLKIQ